MHGIIWLLWRFRIKKNYLTVLALGKWRAANGKRQMAKVKWSIFCITNTSFKKVSEKNQGIGIKHNIHTNLSNV